MSSALQKVLAHRAPPGRADGQLGLALDDDRFVLRGEHAERDEDARPAEIAHASEQGSRRSGG
jgi:hypothetical protein